MKEPFHEMQTIPLAYEGICHALFDSAAEGLVLVNASGTIQLANRRMTELFGYTNEELIGQKIELLVPSEYSHSHGSKREAFNRHPTQRTMGSGRDLLGLRKDGSKFPVEISLNHFDAGGQLLVMALISDISLRKQTEIELERLRDDLERRVQERTRELRESQNLYGIIARNFPNGTINVFDRNLNYIFVEGRELFRMGVTSEQLKGTNFLSRLSPEVGIKIAMRLEEVFNGQNVSFDLEVENKHYEFHAVPLRDADGLILQILVVEMNITQQKRAESDIMKTLDKERQLNELKSRFVSMASHEFRTPLSTILTSLSLVRRYTRPEDEENREKHYNRIRTAVHNLTSILNDFLSLDKLETGLISPTESQIDFRAFLVDAIDELQSMCKVGQQITLSYEGEPNIRTDLNMLRNIVTNLISNAMKYSPENTAIEVRGWVRDQKVRLDVRDHGIGIPDADKPHMFERFFRANNATNIQGTGLGLNIVRKYLDLMGGDIWFESQSGEGSLFSVVLPQNLNS
jgi:PAS domain S-box-containing protein